MKPLERIPVHPFLFALYPVLALFALNLEQVPLGDLVRPLVLALLLAGLALLACRALLRDVQKGAVLASLLLLLFFSYGHLYVFLREQLALAAIARHRILVPAEALAVGAAALGLGRRRLAAWLTPSLNLMSAVAAALVLSQAAYGLARRVPQAADPAADRAEIALSLPQGETPPDVYYVILDAYTRGDALQALFDHDNEPFLDSLRSLGFFIADRSRSNYAVTRLSLPSSLNMNYLDAIGPPLNPAAKDAAWLDAAARYSAVRSAFEALGYRVVAFESAYGMTDWTDADAYLTRRALALSEARTVADLAPFEMLLLQTSMGRLVIDGRTWWNRIFRTEIRAPHEQHRERILFDLDSLAQMAEVEGPKFVFVHIMSPHPPYVFTAGGDPTGEPGFFSLGVDSALAWQGSSRAAYRDQVIYLNKRLLEAVTAILRDSQVPPIIVLQGDHGALDVSPGDRMKILNAYHLPGEGRARVYPTISPVNTFRLIFETYFGADLPLLDDRAFYSSIDRPFDLRPMP